MKNQAKPESVRQKSAMTVIEITVVLSVMLMLASIVVFSTAGIDEWKKGRNAGLELQSVYLAQKSFLADHPTNAVSSITEPDLLPYLQGITAIPSVEGLDGGMRTIAVNQLPPIVNDGGGSAYDPSDSDEDGLWDVGKH